MKPDTPPQQLPAGKEIFLDHVAHFVPDMDAAGLLLEQLGFRLTPFTQQQNMTSSGPVPAGMANRCVMLRQGYVEFLTAISDTELARRFRSAVTRYTGVHLIALSVADPEAAHGRLAAGGFAPEPPVHLRRTVKLSDGTPAEASFTVLRVPPERMPEGRIQILTHHSEEAVWQSRWLDHENGVTSLEATLLVMNDPEEAAHRFGRFAGRKAERRAPDRWLLPLDRGLLVFAEASALRGLAPRVGSPASLPCIAGYALGTRDADVTRGRFAAAGLEGQATASGETTYLFPPALGGFATVVAPAALPSWAG